MKRLVTVLSLSLAAAVALTGTVAEATPLPPDSLYHLPATLTDASGKVFKLNERRGRVQVVTMFYGTCRFACPLIIETLKGVDRGLTDAEKAKVDLLLVSFDPARDTVPALHKIAVERKIEKPRWTMARAEPDDVRKLAAMLEVKYRQLEDGEFNHTNVVALLDEDGRIVARTEKIGPVPDPDFLAQVKKALAK